MSGFCARHISTSTCKVLVKKIRWAHTLLAFYQEIQMIVWPGVTHYGSIASSENHLHHDTYYIRKSIIASVCEHYSCYNCISVFSEYL